MGDPVRITDDEAAILRAWLGGARVDDIARARRISPADVSRVLVELCDLQRDTARRVLEEGTATPTRVAPVKRPRPVLPAPAATPAPLRFTEPDPPGLIVPPTPARPALPAGGFVLERHTATRCADCRYVGPAGEHPYTCAGPPVPVEILIVGVA